MGDSSTLKLNTEATIVKANQEYCYSRYQKCCWQGTTSLTCNNANGSYSGCTRTICNYSAAEEICANFNYAGKTWRLPKSDELKRWDISTAFLGDNGLMLCENNIDGYGSCDGGWNICKGSYDGHCYIMYIWAYGKLQGAGNAAYYTRDGYVAPPFPSSEAFGVRCVTEME